MGNVKIKICGLRTMSDIEIVNEVHPDFAGFIFDPSRKRYIKPEEAHLLIKFLDPQIFPVGVFVNPSMEMILEYLARCPVPIVQLHGQETNAFIEELRSQYYHVRNASQHDAMDSTPGDSSPAADLGIERPIPERLRIIKAFSIHGTSDLELAAASAADDILLDAGAGGTGEKFDWPLVRGFGRPFFLAGGLTPDNVAKAIEETRPYAVDVSSGVEDSDGHKDPAKAAAFVRAVRRGA